MVVDEILGKAHPPPRDRSNPKRGTGSKRGRGGRQSNKHPVSLSQGQKLSE